MKNMKIFSIVFALTVGFNSQAVMAQGTLDNEALEMAFAGNTDMQVMVLSEQEMEQTQGAWVWWAVSGIAGGFANAINYARQTDNFNVGGAAYAFGTGVTGGLLAALPGGGAARALYGFAGGLTAGTAYSSHFNRW